LGDALVLQSAESLSFQFEATNRFGARHTGLDDFQPDNTTRMVLLGFINDAHTALSYRAENFVSSNR
jgi:hypothetical protein